MGKIGKSLESVLKTGIVGATAVLPFVSFNSFSASAPELDIQNHPSSSVGSDNARLVANSTDSGYTSQLAPSLETYYKDLSNVKHNRAGVNTSTGGTFPCPFEYNGTIPSGLGNSARFKFYYNASTPVNTNPFPSNLVISSRIEANGFTNIVNVDNLVQQGGGLGEMVLPNISGAVNGLEYGQVKTKFGIRQNNFVNLLENSSTNMNTLIEYVDGVTNSITFSPTNGVAVVQNGMNIIYTPNSNFFGSDFVGFQAKFGTNLIDTLNRTITVQFVPQPPSIADVNMSGTRILNSGITNPVVASDSSNNPGGAITNAIIAQQPQYGAAVLLGFTNAVYNLNNIAGINGSGNVNDSFKIAVQDNYGLWTINNVSVSETNVAPTISNLSISGHMGMPVTNNVSELGSDVNGDSLTYGVAQQGANTTLSFVNGALKSTPNINTPYTDSAKIYADDGFGDRATNNISYNFTNYPPSAGLVAIVNNRTTNGIPFSFPVTVDAGLTPSVEVLTQPVDGNISVNGTNGTFTSNTSAPISDSFSYRVGDGYNFATNSSNTINLVNRWPTNNLDSTLGANLGVPASLPISKMAQHVSDPDGDLVSMYSFDAAGTNNSTITSDGTNLVYTGNSLGNDLFRTVWTDGNGGFATNNCYVTISQTNQPGNGANIVGFRTNTTNGAMTSVTVTSAGIPGYPYILQASTNLVPPVDWQTLADSATNAPANGLWDYTDMNAPNYSQRFYRTTHP